MLELEIKEARRVIIKIFEVSYDALRTFVNHLYTGERCINEQILCQLMLISDRYQVNYLKTQYEKLVTKLTPVKSLMAYVFAHQCRVKHLFGASLSQVTENMEEVIKSAGYMELVKKDPRLVVEIYEAYMVKQQIMMQENQ